MNLKKRTPVLAVACLFLLLTGVPAAASGGLLQPSDAPVRLLIVDETHSIQSSLQIAQFARAINASGLFEIDAMAQMPAGKNMASASYHFVLVLPERIDQVWIVTTDFPSNLRAAIKRAYEVLEGLAETIYQNEQALDPRLVADVGDGIFPALIPGVLAANGWLMPAQHLSAGLANQEE